MRMAAPPDVPVTVDDAALIEQSWRRPDVFAVLYDRYFDEIYRYLAGRLGPHIADDLAAETFLVAFRKRRSYDAARGAVRPWLYGIATKLLAQHRRSETRRLSAFQRAPVDVLADDGPEDRVTTRVAAANAQGRLASALERLSHGDRDVLLLIALADLSYEEVAQVLDIPFGTVGSRLNRARKKLRAALGGTNPMIGGSDG